MAGLTKLIKKSFTNDLTTCSIPRGILGLAVPMITASVFQSIQSLVDMFFVGRLGAAAVASVGMAGMILMLLATVFIGLHTAIVAMIARSIGAGDESQANHFAGQSLVLTVLFSIAIGIGGYLASKIMLQGLGGNAEVVELGTGYLHISFSAIFFLAAIFVLNGILHGAGDAVTPLLLGIFVTVFNIILNPIMIFGYLGFPAMGVSGSALATVIARTAAFAIGIAVLLRGNLRVHVRRCDLKPSIPTMWKIFTISLPSTLQMGTRTLMNVLLMSIAAKFGTAVVAAYTVGFRIRMITLFPSFGFGGSAATMVGQNLGAKLPERARNSAITATAMAFVVTGTCGAITFFFARQIIYFFNTDPMVVLAGTQFLRISALGLCAAPIGIVLSRSLNGAGDTISPFIISLLSLWGFQIPAALYLSGISEIWGVALPFQKLAATFSENQETGIWYAMVLASLLQATITSLWFALGRWKHQKIY